MQLKLIESLKKIFKFLTKNGSILILILLIGAFLRFNGLTVQSLWLDEIHTMNASNPSLSLGNVLKSVKSFESRQPPLYFVSIHYWFKLVGFNDLSARFFAALGGFLGLIAIYLLGREIYSRRVGLIASILTAVNYFHLYYSQEARSYSFVFLFTVLSYFFLIRTIKKPSRRNSIFYLITTFLMVYTHYYGFAVLVAQGLTVLAFLLIENHQYRLKLLKHFVLSCAILLVIYSHWIPRILKAAHTKDFWIQKPQSGFFINYFKFYFGMQSILVSLFLLLILFYFFKAVNDYSPEVPKDIAKLGNLSLSFNVILVWIVLSYLIPYVFSLVKIPILHERYTIITLPAILLSIAVGLELVKFNFLRNFLLIVIIIISGTDLFYDKKYYNQLFKQQWREVATFVASNNPGDFPVSHQKEWYYKYYFEQLNYPVNFIRLTEGMLKEVSLSDAPTHFTGYGVWILQGHDDVSVISRALERVLIENFTVVKEAKYVNAWGKLYFKYRYPQLDIFNFNGGNLTRSPEGDSVILFNNGIIESDPVHFGRGRYHLYIHCKGTDVNGQYPHVNVRIGKTKIGNFYTQDFYQDYQLSFTLENDRSANIRIIYDNDTYIKETGEDRNLYIKCVMVTGPH